MVLQSVGHGNGISGRLYTIPAEPVNTQKPSIEKLAPVDSLLALESPGNLPRSNSSVPTHKVRTEAALPLDTKSKRLGV